MLQGDIGVEGYRDAVGMTVIYLTYERLDLIVAFSLRIVCLGLSDSASVPVFMCQYSCTFIYCLLIPIMVLEYLVLIMEFVKFNCESEY